MKFVFIRSVFLCIVLQMLFSCQTTTAKEQTQIEVPKKENPINERQKIVKIGNSYDFFLAGDNLWIFFKDRLEIIKSPTEKEVIYYKRFKTETTCQKIVKPNVGTNGAEKGGLRAKKFTDCIPRPSRVRRSGLREQFSEIFERGYWVLREEVVIELGKQLYFFTFDGNFLRIENREKGWHFEELPNSRYDWRYDEKGFHFDNKKFGPGNPAVFSGPWVLRIRGRHKKKRFELIDRSTAEIRQTFEATDPLRGLELIEFREYGDGFYIDRIRTPTEMKNNIFYPIRRSAWWFGKTVIDLKSDAPSTHCYVYKEKKKCIPMPTPCTLVNGKRKCIPLRERSYPQESLRGVLETEKMLIRVYDEELGVEFK